jgi:GABA(A) receptor-associated protein
MLSFKTKYSESQRKLESAKITRKYPDRVPVIVERSHGSSLPDIDKHKFLVPGDLSIGQFITIIRKRTKLSPEEGIFVFVDPNRNNEDGNQKKSSLVIPPTSSIISNIYEEYKSPCGFLLVVYTGENVYG